MPTDCCRWLSRRWLGLPCAVYRAYRADGSALRCCAFTRLKSEPVPSSACLAPLWRTLGCTETALGTRYCVRSMTRAWRARHNSRLSACVRAHACPNARSVSCRSSNGLSQPNCRSGVLGPKSSVATAPTAQLGSLRTARAFIGGAATVNVALRSRPALACHVASCVEDVATAVDLLCEARA